MQRVERRKSNGAEIGVVDQALSPPGPLMANQPGRRPISRKIDRAAFPSGDGPPENRAARRCSRGLVQTSSRDFSGWLPIGGPGPSWLKGSGEAAR